MTKKKPASRLRRLRLERGLTQQELSDLTGGTVAPNTISEAERGRVDTRGGTLERLARALDVPVDELLRGDGGIGPGANASVVSADSLLQDRRAMKNSDPDRSPMERGQAPRYFGVVQQRGDVEPAGWITQFIPVVRQRMKEWMGPLEAEEPIPLAVPRPGHYRAIRVVGESMEPECSPGDLAIVDCDASPRVGQAVVVEVGGEEALRYLAELTPERVVLAAENPMMPDIVVPPSEAEIVGVIVAYQRLPKELRRPMRRVG